MHLKDLVFAGKFGLNVVAPLTVPGGSAGPIADDLLTGGFNSVKNKIERFKDFLFVKSSFVLTSNFLSKFLIFVHSCI